MAEKTSLLVRGLHGLGDNLHQRPVLRHLMQNHNLILETSWPCIYHDLVGDNLRFVSRPVALRTQLKNTYRERDKFSDNPPAHHRMPSIRFSYTTKTINECPSRSVLEAMYKAAAAQSAYADADLSFPVPDEWSIQLFNEITKTWPNTGKPLLIYRPLCVRPEYRGSQVRNANAADYAEIFAAIRDNFFVVSVADLEPMREWIVGPELKADVTFHKGELHFEWLAALFKSAACVYTSGGFAAVLAPAVGTPCIDVLGGYEPLSWLADGAKHAPWLGIPPIQECQCGTSFCTNPCTKKIDVPAAIASVRAFVSAHCNVSTFAESRSVSEVFGPATVTEPIPANRHELRQQFVRPGSLEALVRRHSAAKA